MRFRWAKRPSAGLSKCWLRRHERGIASLNYPFTIAIAVTAAPRWPAHWLAASRQLTTWYADPCARLLNVFEWTYERQFERTIVTSSDSPQISRAIVARARAALDEADVVLGPAEDGGYYLIAMRKPYDVFSSVPMSTGAVTRKTIELAERQGLSVRLLEPLFDIDELPDLLRLAQLLEADQALAPVTAAYLATRKNLYDNHIRTHAPTFDLHRADQPV